MALTLSEQWEKVQEDRDKQLLAAVEYEMIGAVAHSGGELTGFSVKFGSMDVLLTLRAVVTSNQCIAFIGAPSLADCFRKAVVHAYHDELRWKKDAFHS